MTEEERELEARCEAYRRAREDLAKETPFEVWTKSRRFLDPVRWQSMTWNASDTG
ncbi:MULTISPECIES: hypothetical protein [Nonomuraea]|uniref:Uncharacterized protein n=3 Tax=Nonomuraea TaxID=83681 RepID=A0A7W5VP58_9ACTN|nr:hypothetical protein [Nonomuraea dietziae]MBB3731702.1 hypothetical protein [Nonomuraea dietziae]